MKLLLENWRGYLNEYRKDPTDLGKIPFASKRSREEKAALAKEHPGFRWTRDHEANSEAMYEVIVGYVIHGRQPDSTEVSTLKTILDSNRYPDILRWYDGAAYRGMLITDDWLDKWISTEFGGARALEKTQKKKKWMTRKHVFNLFKKFRKEITSNVNMFYNPDYTPSWDQYGTPLHGGKESKIIESWSRNYEVAKNYAMPAAGSLRHQQVGFRRGLRHQLKRRRDSGYSSEGVLSIILESSDKNTFLDLEPLYKSLPKLAPEARIQEVPSIDAHSLKVDKVHIPYGDFQKAYEFATKDWSSHDKSILPPYIKEEAERAGVILL